MNSPISATCHRLILCHDVWNVGFKSVSFGEKNDYARFVQYVEHVSFALSFI